MFCTLSPRCFSANENQAWRSNWNSILTRDGLLSRHMAQEPTQPSIHQFPPHHHSVRPPSRSLLWFSPCYNASPALNLQPKVLKPYLKWLCPWTPSHLPRDSSTQMDNLEPRCYPEEGGVRETEAREGSGPPLLKEVDHEPQNIGYRIHRLPLEAENNQSLVDNQQGNGTSVWRPHGTKFWQHVNELGRRFIPQSLQWGTQPCWHFDFSLVKPGTGNQLGLAMQTSDSHLTLLFQSTEFVATCWQLQ